jgi:hypothetical protein
MKKVATNSQRAKFINSLPLHHVDPTVRPEAVVKAIHDCFAEHEVELSPGDLPYETAREAILELLRLTSEVNEGEFWDAWDLPSDFCIDAVPEPFQTARKRKLVRMQELLRSKTITQKTLVRAMETIDDAITSMRMEFSLALIPDGGLDESIMESERYRIAAMLGSIWNLLNKFWYPIRDQLRYPGSIRRNK